MVFQIKTTHDFAERMNWLTQMWNILLVYLNQETVDVERVVQLVLSQTLESMLMVSVINVNDRLENAQWKDCHCIYLYIGIHVQVNSQNTLCEQLSERRFVRYNYRSNGLNTIKQRS